MSRGMVLCAVVGCCVVCWSAMYYRGLLCEVLCRVVGCCVLWWGVLWCGGMLYRGVVGVLCRVVGCCVVW